MPSKFLPVGERVGLRGTAGLPGGGLEDALRASAFTRASRTGAFVGPLAEPARSMSGILDPRGQAFGASSLPSGAPTGTAGIFDAQVANAQKVTDSVYSMVGKNTFRDFSQQAAQITAKSKPGLIDELRTNAAIASADILGKAGAASTSITSKGRSGITAAAELIDDVISLGKTAATATGIGARAKQGIERFSEVLSGGYLDDIINDGGSITQDASVFSQIKNKAKTAIDFVQDVFSMAKGAGGVSGLVGGGSGGPRPPAGSVPGAGGGEGPEQMARQLLGLDALGDISRISTRELETLSATFSELRAILDPTVEGFDQLNKRLRNTAANIDRQLERRAPDADLLTRSLGPRTGRAVSEGLIGGAFPLLFGQGIGASAGGLIGGAAGGFAGGGLGFGLSLVGTALGTVFDTLAQAAQDTGKALNYPIEGFEKLKAAGLFASRDQEYYISKLIETGQTSKATAEIQAEMIKKIGVSGVNDLADLGDASIKLSKAWAEFNLQLQAALAGPMAGLLEWVTSVVELSNGGVQKEAQNLDPEAFRKAQEQANRTAQQGKPFFSDQDRVAYEKELNRLSRGIIAKTGVPLIKETKQDPAQQEAALQAQRQVADQIKSAYREGFQLQQRAIDLELKTVEISRRIEDEIFNRRQEILRQQVDNDRKRAEIAIEAVDLEYRKRIANEEGVAAQVLTAQADAIKSRAQGEANIAAAKKLLEFDIAKQQRNTQNYVYALSREADSIRRETLSLEMEVADYRLKIEREIENERLVAAAAEKAGATTTTTAAQARGGAAAFMTGGAFDTGLRTGPSSVIGGSAPYHQDISFGPSVGLEQQRQLVVALAKAYDDMGRKIELSNEAVQGRVFPLRGTIAEQNKFITDALAAHRGRNGGTGRSAIDFYTPAKGGNRFGESVVNTAMYAPVVPGASLAYGRGGDAGSSITATKGGQKIFQLMHGRTDIPLPGASAIARRVAEAQPSTAAQLEQARSQVRRPVITPVPVGMATGAMTSFDAQDARLKRDALAIDAKAAEIQKERNIQQIYESARGPIDIKRRQEELRIAQAELGVIGAMSGERQAMLLAEIQGREKIGIIEADNARIAMETSKNKGLTQAEKEATFRGLSDRLANAKAEVALDAQALNIAQQRNLIEGAAQETNRIYEEIEARKLRNRLALDGVAPEIIEGEVRVLALQKGLTVALEAHDKQLAKLIGTTYDGTTSTYESAVSKLSELEALGQLTPAQKALREELEKILKARQGIADATPGAIKGAKGAAEASIMSPREKIEGRIGEIKKEIAKLTDVGNIAITVADSIGNAFGQAFQGLISGSMSAQEALSSFFQSIADAFLDMATQIIAKQLVMITLQTILKILGAVSGGGGTGDSAKFGLDTPEMRKYAPLAANGAYFSDGMASFANGGAFTNSIVSSPTLFRFADGGVTKTGEMGEAGPEAIMPLSRGAGGRLGVDASGLRAAMGPAPGSGGGSPVLSMSFETTTIGGVEYVSREQLEAAMAETKRAATKDGAKRGMTMTLDKIQNSSSARRRIGV